MKNSFTDRLIIQQYLEGKLDRKASYELEKQALEDEFLADALEGYHSVKYPHQHLSLLQQQLEERIAAEHLQKTAVAATAQRLSIAAAAAVVFILAGILFWLNGVKTQQSDNTTKTVEVNLADSKGFNRAQPNKNAVATWHTEPEATTARPTIGWVKYNEYLESNVRNATVTGPVLLRFSVDPQGNLKDFQVLRGISAAEDAEAVRLIRNGPEWTAAANGKVSTMEVTIHFKR